MFTPTFCPAWFSIICNPVHAVTVLIWIVAGTTGLQAMQARASSPARLEVGVARTTVRQGDSTPIVIQFLDRRYRTTVNDVLRDVTLSVEPADTRRRGAGFVRPVRVRIRPGESVSRVSSFVAQSPGRVVVRADSPGLETSQALVIIVPRSRSWLDYLAGAPVYADTPIQVDIFPDRFAQPFAANGRTPVKFSVNLSRALEARESLRIRVSTFPGVQLSYGEKEWPGSADIIIGEGNAASDVFRLTSESPGTVRVRARILPDGPEAAVDVPFVLPEPQKIVFEPSVQTIPADQSDIPLLVQLVDQQGVPLSRADRDYRIEISCVQNPQSIELQPATIVLARQQSLFQPRIHVKRVPRSREITLVATDAEGRLQRGEMKIIIRSFTSVSTLLLLSGFGGLLGALIRQFYRERVAHLLPRRDPARGHLLLGLLGHSLFGVVFGIVASLAILTGLLGPIVSRDTLENLYGGPRALGFVFGVIGGFSGVVVLLTLADKWFPRVKPTAAAAAGTR